MNKSKSLFIGALTLSGLLAGVDVVGARSSAASVPYATPPGITLVNVSKIMDDAIPQYMWRRLGNAEGKPLYTFDRDQKGRSNCEGECASEFPPFVPAADAKAAGDFSIIRRKGGLKQWVYQGKPLYRYSGTDPKGEPVGQRFQLKEDPAWMDPASSIYSPKQAWRRAAFTPEQTMLMPPDVAISALAIANGFAFVQSHTKMALYAAARSQKLSRDWQPLHASALALPVGDFTIVKGGADGSRQWAYKGEVLYTFAEDYAPGEVSGTLAEQNVHPALAYQNFTPADVTVHQYLRGPLLTTKAGATLYTQARYSTLYGGTETRTSYAVSYNEAKTQGTVGCAGDCTVTWKPLIAPASAKSWGFWEVYTRPDGVKQWSFKGSPLYTYAGDSQPGDINGNNRHVIVYGGPQGQIVYANAGNDPRSPEAKLGALAMKDVAEGLGRFARTSAAAAANDAGQVKDGAQAGGGAQVAQATNAGGATKDDAQTDAAQADAARGNFHSPGFYWHTAVVFY